MSPADRFASWTGLPAEALQGWVFAPIEREGHVVALAALDGTEIHFAVAPEWRHRLIQRQLTRRFLAPLLERRGYLTTRALSSDGHDRFLRRLGFVPTGARDGVDHYMLTALPFRGD